MAQQLFLGIDGGQSSTRAAICDQRGRLLGAGKAGPANHVHEPGGMARLEKALRESLLAAWQAAGFSRDTELPAFRAACCGMTGGVEQTPALMAQLARIENLVVDYDLPTAHAGALAGEPGAIVIAGTGSVAYGVNAAGQSARAGGWAHIMGDEGSGYDIGRQALRAAARAQDGRGPRTRLLEAVLAFFQQDDLWQVRMLVYSQAVDRQRIAQLAPLVVRAAEGGDLTARTILDQAGEALAEIGQAVLVRLGMAQTPARLSPVGGVFQAGPAILEPFERALRAGAPQVTIVPPAYPPVLGAVLIAMKAAGLSIDKRRRGQLLLASRELGAR
jgi:N-acetylglucosamine kinase-like BadF-type ATPase